MIINLFDDVEKLNYQNLYKNNAHLNKIGHREISKIIYKYVKMKINKKNIIRILLILFLIVGAIYLSKYISGDIFDYNL